MAVSSLLAQGLVFVEDTCYTDCGVVGDGFRMASTLHLLLPYFYYYISVTSEHQLLDLGGGGPLRKRISVNHKRLGNMSQRNSPGQGKMTGFRAEKSYRKCPSRFQGRSLLEL